MFQKFYTDTLGSRFIKSLLAQTPIPLFDCVTDGDHLIEGRYYVYKRFLIKCVSSGVLAVSTKETLFPSYQIFPSVFLFPGIGLRCATFNVKAYVDEPDPKTHSVFKSTTNYYDSETHYHLGRYLRYLYATTGLNLLPYYNVYNSTYFTDIELTAVSQKDVSVSRVSKQRFKVIAVPIRFGTSYSIAIDCPTQVLMRACIHDRSGYIEETLLPVENPSSNITSLINTLQDSGRVYSNLRFDSPVNFRVETSSPRAAMLQHNLYLIIQLPSNNDSSIVVLENFNLSSGIQCDENSIRQPQFFNASLLRMNTHSTYAFSDRLIEYLLGGVVSETDLVNQNTAMIQTYIGKIFPEYNMSFIKGQHKKGVWDKDISRLVYKLLEDTKERMMYYDQDGNINKDTETLIYSFGGKGIYD